MDKILKPRPKNKKRKLIVRRPSSSSPLLSSSLSSSLSPSLSPSLSSSSIFEVLHDELLINIFCRLPCETTYACKCVSKRWLSLISDPSFVNWYLDHKTNTDPTFILKCMSFTMVKMLNKGNQHETTFVTVNKDNGNLMLPNLTLDFLPRQVKVSSTFKDLVLCYGSISTSLKTKLMQYIRCNIPTTSDAMLQYEKDLQQIQHQHEQQAEEPKRQYYICNPLTRQWLSLAPLTLLPVFDDESDFLDALVCEDANDRTNLNKFRVVVMAFPSLELMVFSSEIGQWRNIHLTLDPTVDEIHLPYRRCPQGVVCNKTIYFGYILTYGEFDPFSVTSETCDGATLVANSLSNRHSQIMSVELIECGGRLLGIMSANGGLYIWELSSVATDDNASRRTWKSKDDLVSFLPKEFLNVAAVQPKNDEMDEVYLVVKDKNGRQKLVVGEACSQTTLRTFTSRLPQQGFSIVGRHKFKLQPSPTPLPVLPFL